MLHGAAAEKYGFARQELLEGLEVPIGHGFGEGAFGGDDLIVGAGLSLVASRDPRVWPLPLPAQAASSGAVNTRMAIDRRGVIPAMVDADCRIVDSQACAEVLAYGTAVRSRLLIR